MVLAVADSRENQSVSEHVGLESHYADDVSETGKKNVMQSKRVSSPQNGIQTRNMGQRSMWMATSRVNLLEA